MTASSQGGTIESPVRGNSNGSGETGTSAMPRSTECSVSRVQPCGLRARNT